MKTFEDYLKSQDIDVKDGRVLIEDAHKISKHEFDFETLTAKEQGLPKKFEQDADTVITVLFDEMSRENQEPEKFGCEIVTSEKSYGDDDCWSGEIKGKVRAIWEWAINESGLSVGYINDSIETALEDFHENSSTTEK